MKTPTTLYHFCSGRHLAGIRKSGLALGAIPWTMLETGGISFMRGYQWLTQNPDWHQKWADPKFALLPYRRTEWRIAIQIPAFAQKRLITWKDFSAKHSPESEQFLNSFSDSKYWALFHGIIPVSWFIATDRNPTPIDLTHLDEIGN